MKSNNSTIYFDLGSSKIPLKKIILKNSEVDNLNIADNTDLVPGKYEGGVKIWECSLDLLRYLSTEFNKFSYEDKNVLELGCGHGFPGLFALLKGANVTFQDFNEEVLDQITRSYVETLEASTKQKLLPQTSFVSGDWSKLKFKNKDEIRMFDLILMSETIYNIDNFESLIKIIDRHLTKDGIVLISSKKWICKKTLLRRWRRIARVSQFYQTKNGICG